MPQRPGGLRALCALTAAVFAAAALAACGGGATSGASGEAGSSGAGGGGSGGATSSGGTSAGGAGGGFSCSGAAPSYAKDVEPILTCGANEMCHSLSLGKPGGAYSYLVGVPSDECPDGRLRVAPGDPAHSYLIDKLTDHNLCAGVAMPKPPMGMPWQPLSKPDIQTVYDWICQGAKSD